ncbi:MAG: hypothetical protein ABIK23_03170 [candidate division WOR-3 bacterium]
MKKLIAACAIVALIFALGCPSKKAEEKAKPTKAESTLTVPPPESAAVTPAESVKAPAESVKAPEPAPQPKPAPQPSGKPPKVGR